VVHSDRAPKKGLGQNFLVSEGTARRIVGSLGTSAGDLVFEIGPGRGALTMPLAEAGARVVAYEIDGALAKRLEERCAPFSGVEIIHRDIRDTDLDGEAGRLGYDGYRVIGNIPYHLTSTILLEVPEWRGSRRTVLMVQREVGDRILASPGDRNCGILTVFLRAYTNPGRILRVPPGSFRPKPKVDSVVLSFTHKEPPVAPGDRADFLGFIKWSFSERRKMLRNVYRRGRGTIDATSFIERAEKAGLRLDRRPEELSLGDWIGLYSLFTGCKDQA